MIYIRWILICSLLLTPLFLFTTLPRASAQTSGVDTPIAVGSWEITLIDAFLVDEIVSGNDKVYSPDKESYSVLITRLHITHQELDDAPQITMQTFDMKLLDAEGDAIADTIGFRYERYFCMKSEACHSISLTDEAAIDTEYIEYAYVVSPQEAEAELALEVALGHPVEPNIVLDTTNFAPSPNVFGISASITAAHWAIRVTGVDQAEEIEGVFQRKYSANDGYDFLLVDVEFENRDPARPTTLRHRDFDAVIRNSAGSGKKAIGAGTSGTGKYCLWSKGCLGATDKGDTSTISLEYVFVVEETWLQEPVELESVLMIPAEPTITFTVPFAPAAAQPEPSPTDTPTRVPIATPTAIPTPTPSPTIQPTSSVTTDCMGTVDASGAINMRDGPSTNHSILTSVSPAKEITVIGESDDWYEVVFDEREGWIAGWLLSLSGPCTHLRPGTGILQDERPSSGRGRLTIANGRTDDAAAILAVLETGSPIVAAFIRAGETFTITDIPDGDYALYFSLGDDWHREREEFTTDVRRARFEDTLTFETTRSGTTVTYSTFEVTLHAVEGGTAATQDVPASEFPHLSD